MARIRTPIGEKQFALTDVPRTIHELADKVRVMRHYQRRILWAQSKVIKRRNQLQANGKELEIDQILDLLELAKERGILP